MGMSQSYGPADERESIATLHRAIEIGCNFFDTAQGYGPLTNEELLGRAFKDRRDQVVSGTKFGFRLAMVSFPFHSFIVVVCFIWVWKPVETASKISSERDWFA